MAENMSGTAEQQGCRVPEERRRRERAEAGCCAMAATNAMPLVFLRCLDPLVPAHGSPLKVASTVARYEDCKPVRCKQGSESGLGASPVQTSDNAAVISPLGSGLLLLTAILQQRGSSPLSLHIPLASQRSLNNLFLTTNTTPPLATIPLHQSHCDLDSVHRSFLRYGARSICAGKQAHADLFAFSAHPWLFHT